MQKQIANSAATWIQRIVPAGWTAYGPAVVVTAVLLSAWVPLRAEWSHFRGDAHQAVADVELDEGWGLQAPALAWKQALPGRGVSSPIVVKNRVVLTASSGVNQDRLHVLAFDATTGRKLWHRQFWATGRTASHPTSANAAPTPASDGEAIFAFYSSNDLICLDLDGNLRWYRGLGHDYPRAANDVGMSSSPVVVGGAVVVQVENQGDSFVAGIDVRTGANLWRTPRELAANWSSPAILPGRNGAADLVLLKSSTDVSAHEPLNGKAVWSYATPEADGIPSAVAIEDLIFVPGGNLTVLRSTANPASPELVWQSNKVRPGPSSPVVHNGQIFALNQSGVVTCADVAMGEVQWQKRIKGSCWATPVLIDGRLICVNQDGLLQILDVRKQGDVTTELELGAPVLGSPAVGEDGMFLRSDGTLWKFAF